MRLCPTSERAGDSFPRRYRLVSLSREAAASVAGRPMTTIKIADDWLDAVRASLGARCRLGRPGRTGDARRLRRAQRSIGRRARLRQHRRAWPRARRRSPPICCSASDGTWRFRIYRRGESIPLADMLPLLDQLGLRALDERAFGFVFDGVTVWLHDVGVAVPAGRPAERRDQGRGATVASSPSSAVRSRSTGSIVWSSSAA